MVQWNEAMMDINSLKQAVGVKTSTIPYYHKRIRRHEQASLETVSAALNQNVLLSKLVMNYQSSGSYLP